jgi:hypothetical protein
VQHHKCENNYSRGMLRTFSISKKDDATICLNHLKQIGVYPNLHSMKKQSELLQNVTHYFRTLGNRAH